ncbi:TetR/AcrR family transcriptional regulator [Curtobacterium sp. MCPF17_052]|uniref:TetR/AcrR family transcriptional regulator n=1 Tax=Curtobacterium sp. MCPF17_052 TaxID=2175655 RepID=UPI0024DF8AA9|nr:hypothetical protein [Curtobacterium sp. MCPF17_052]WIB12851.1 hypothetical protein DEJ36_01990 [Curtobacterium sp. MCPF17_052]
MGTVYRHFPTRADLVLAVYRHQVEACAEAGPRFLSEASDPDAALRQWIGLFVDFLVTKHGLPVAMHGDGAATDALHRYFVDRLVPVCGDLLTAARAAVPGRATSAGGHRLRTAPRCREPVHRDGGRPGLRRRASGPGVRVRGARRRPGRVSTGLPALSPR